MSRTARKAAAPEAAWTSHAEAAMAERVRELRMGLDQTEERRPFLEGLKSTRLGELTAPVGED